MNRRKKTVTPSEWVVQSIKESKKDFMDIHFDIFKDYENQKGVSLLKYACHILIEARSAATELKSKERFFKPFIHLPFGCHFTFIQWDNSNWIRLGKKNGQAIYEPPSLYILAKRELLFANLNMEEYRCPIKFPEDLLFNEKNKILVLFRCFRDQQSLENSWEFSTGIHLHYAGDF